MLQIKYLHFSTKLAIFNWSYTNISSVFRLYDVNVKKTIDWIVDNDIEFILAIVKLFIIMNSFNPIQCLFSFLFLVILLQMTVDVNVIYMRNLPY